MREPGTARDVMLNQIEDRWTRLIRKLESFPEAELLTPNVIGIWTLKDLIGHLETWDAIAIQKIEYAEQGEQRSWAQVVDSPDGDIDIFNEMDAAANQHKSINQLWEELHRRHGELVERIRTADDVRGELIAEDTWEHYDAHLQDIMTCERQINAARARSLKR